MWLRSARCASTDGRVAEPGFGGPLVLDNSAWSRLLGGRVPEPTRRRWREALDRDEVLVCDPFRLEALYSARDADDYRALAEELGALRQAPCDDVVWELARAAQATLAEDRRVSHRVKPVDLLVAAVAHEQALGVLHYDPDYDTIADRSELRIRSVWIAPRGSMP